MSPAATTAAARVTAHANGQHIRYVDVNKARHTATYTTEKGETVFTESFIDYDNFARDVAATATPKDGPYVRILVGTAFPFAALLSIWLLPLIGNFYWATSRALRVSRQAATHAAKKAARDSGVAGAAGTAGGGASTASRGSKAEEEEEEGPPGMPAKRRFRFKLQTEIKTRLNDVAGLTEAKMEVQEIVDFLKHPRKYTDLGAKLPKGILIDGPPGVGKTMLARAVAGEAGLPFVSCSGSEFDEVYVGVGAMRVRELFKSARENAPCVVFIDEIDTFGKKRQRDARGSSRGTINAVLSELDGFKDASPILVLAATNRADVLDDALTRSGRFDRKITVDNPTLKDRIAIAKVHLRPLLLEQGLTIDGVSETLGALTPGCSGADIFNVCNEAAITASRLKKTAVDMECFNAALDRTLVGLKRGARKLKTFEKERLAIHEAGKVVLSWFQPSTDPIMKATIAPHGGMMRGKTLRLPQEKYIITQQQLHERMVQRLGGYVAEKYFFSDVSANAADDLEQVTDSAHQEITVYGMLPDVVGHFGFPGERNAYEALPYGPEKANVIDKSVTTLMQQTQRAAEALLQKYVTEVRIVAGTLLAQETVTARELYLLLGERPVMSDEFRKYLETAHSAGPKPAAEDDNAATPAAPTVALPDATGAPATPAAA